MFFVNLVRMQPLEEITKLLNANHLNQAVTRVRMMLEQKSLSHAEQISLFYRLTSRLIAAKEFDDALFFLLRLFVKVPTCDVAMMIVKASDGQNIEVPHHTDHYFQFAVQRCLTQLPSVETADLQKVHFIDDPEVPRLITATMPHVEWPGIPVPSLNHQHYWAFHISRASMAPPIRIFRLQRGFLRANDWSYSVYSEEGKLLAPGSSSVFPPPAKEERFLWLHGRCSLIGDSVIKSNYCHWTLDVLPRVLYTRAYISDPVSFWIVGEFNQPFQEQSLAALGIPRTQIVSLRDHPLIKAEELICQSDSSHETKHPARNGWGGMLVQLREQLLSSIGVRWETKRERIYISRADAAPRKVFGEEQLSKALKDELGFTSYRLSELSYAEQLRLFAAAEAVVAPHGAGLANILFCRPGTHVVEILNPRYGTHAYAQTALALKLDYVHICGESVLDGSRIPATDHNSDLGHEDFIISSTEQLKIVEHLRAALKKPAAPYNDSAIGDAPELAVRGSAPSTSALIIDCIPAEHKTIIGGITSALSEIDIRALISIGQSLPEDACVVSIQGNTSLAFRLILEGLTRANQLNAQLFKVGLDSGEQMDIPLLKQLSELRMNAEAALYKFPNASIDLLLIDLDYCNEPDRWSIKMSRRGRAFAYRSSESSSVDALFTQR